MKTANEMLVDMGAALAHHEQEATRLRAAIAALSGAAPAPAQQPIVLPYPVWVPPILPAPQPPIYPGLGSHPWIIQTGGHGGACACPQCCPSVICGTVTMQPDLVAFAEAGGRVDINCNPSWTPPYMVAIAGSLPFGASLQ